MKLSKISKRMRIIFVSCILAASTIFFAAWDDNEFEMAKNLDIYHTLFRELNLYYVDKTNSGDLVKKSIDGMLKNLDPYTVFIPESRIEDYKFQRTGEYGGIGAGVRMMKKNLVVTDVYDGYAAQKAGLRIGDTYKIVDGKSVENKSIAQLSQLLKGQPGTKVVVKVKRAGSDELIELNITREKIKVKNVPYYGMLDDNIGYIKLIGFRSNASGEIKDALKELKNKNNIKGVVLDLRGNPGGLLTESVNIVNIFVTKGEEIVSMKGKVKRWIKTFRGHYTPIDTEIPVVVLINSGSASASEIVSGALQDLDRAVIVGKRSFGKGLVQTTRMLSYNTQLKLTTAKYYIPSGRCIQALDYTHRKTDGSVGKVPDSLITEFKTKNGRKVYDGGGINPDIEVDKKNQGSIIKALFKENHFFNFATKYAMEHDSIASASEFVLTDANLNAFVTYLSEKQFSYENNTETQLSKLIKQAKEDNYFEMGEKELLALQNKFEHNIDKDIEIYKDAIIGFLSSEIAGRYYYDKGRIITSLENDKDIDKALELLNEEGLTTYKSILSGEK